jgi:PAS domain S-box-containing protein
LILLDVRLKGMDGLEVCRRLQECEATRHIPVILLSAFAEVQDLRKALQLGAVDYLTKPFQAEELLARVRTHLSLSQSYASLAQQAAALRQANALLQSEIVARQGAEAQQFNSRQMLRLILDTIPQRVFWKDRNLVYQDCNQSFAQDAGCRSPREVIGKTDFELGWEENAVHYCADDQAVMENGCAKLNFEETQLTPAGRQIWLKTSKFPLRDMRGAVMGVLGTYDDITERKQADAALRASEVRYRRLFEAAQDGILILDAETGMVVDVNPFLIKLLGFSRETFLGMEVWELGFFKDIVANQDHFAELQQKEYIRYEDRPLETADGRRIDVEFVSNVYLVNDHKVIQCNIRDITERKRAQAALHDKERLLSESQRLGHIGSWLYDLTGPIFWSEEMYRLYGVSPATFLPTMDSLLRLIHPDDRSAMQRWVAACAAGEKPGALEFRIHLPDGTIRFFRGVGEAVHDANKKLLHMAGAVQDITDRKLAAEEIHRLNQTLEQRVIERTAQLQASNQELEAFSYSVSHDLRAPLRAIDGWAQALLDDFSGQLGEVGCQLLDRQRAASQRMGVLIDDLLRLSRLTRQPLTCQSVAPAALVKRVWEELRAAHPSQAAELVMGPLPECQADPALLTQVFVNLLGNAWKFSSGSAHPRIEVGSQAGADGGHIFFVKDNGVGFDMTYAHKLFGAFQRLHSHHEFPGTGIGLAIVQRIIRRHGGRIWAESVLGEGATFYFTLPNHDPAPKEDAP